MTASGLYVILHAYFYQFTYLYGVNLAYLVMISKQKSSPQANFFFYLEDTLNRTHPLFILSSRIDWQRFEDAFAPLYCADNGTPAKPLRLTVGLLILKHLRNVSNESVVEQWTENLYYQYFCGLQQFSADSPCASSDLTHFRKRIGEAGIELSFGNLKSSFILTINT